MNNLRRSIPPLGCLLLLLVASSPTLADWPAGGIKLSAITPSRAGAVCADGAGGVFIVASDEAHYRLSDLDCRAYRLAVGGTRPDGWPSSGVGVSQSEWADVGTSCVLNADRSFTFAYSINDWFAQSFARRINTDGQYVASWPTSGSTLASGSYGQTTQSVVALADGSALFAIYTGWTNWDIWLQRLTADGQIAPGWPAAGKEFVAGPSWQVLAQEPSLLSDGGNGAWIAYTSDQEVSTEANVYLARIDSLGDPAPGWPRRGRVVTAAPGIQTQAAIAHDGADGVFIAWVDARSRAGQPSDQAEFGWDIYMQRFNADGSLSAGWPELGLPVCTAPTMQNAPHVVADGTGGVFIEWDYAGDQGFSVHVQQILADGSIALGWPAGGKRMFDFDSYNDRGTMVSDGTGGVFVSCATLSGGAWDVPVQHVNGAGVFDTPWGPSGYRVGDLGGMNDDQDYPRLVTSLPGSVIICWDDDRAGGTESYLQRLTVDGVVATELSLASHDAQPDHVSLEWAGANAMLVSATLERREPAAEWRTLADLTVDAEGRLTYVDHDVTPGATYEYRLRYTSDGLPRTTAIITIAVPTATPFALKGATPNPSPRHKLAIAYSLAERGSARLDLFDAQGRCVATREVGALGIGAHTVTFDEARSLRTGLYWVRLTQGARRATARVVIVD